jgi:methylmalonyl-CoA mutase
MEDNKLFAEFPPITTEKWEEAINNDLKGADYEKKLVWKTIEGFKVKPYYRAEDLQGLEYLDANPDQFPFTRGKKEKCNTWDVRQNITEKEPAKANAYAVEALQRGANSLGFCACHIASLDDMQNLLNGIKLDEVKINFVCAKDWIATMQLYVEAAKNMGFDAKKCEGSLNYDPFRQAMKHGRWMHNDDEEIQEALQILRYATDNLPKFRVITVNGNLFRNAGSNITQELGFSLAAANEWVAKLTEKGLKPEEIASKLVLSFATGSTYFMEIAKIRAARLLWSKIIKEYHPGCDCAYKIFIHSDSAIWNKSIYDPYVNMLRTTTETMSAAIAGADSISVEPFDIAYKETDDFSYRIARNQQLLLKEESYMDKIVDPAAGSYYIENLTNSIAQYAWQQFLAVEEKGGFRKSVDAGFIQDEVAKMAQQLDQSIAQRRIHILGTNIFPNLNEKGVDHIQDECCGYKKHCCCHHEEQPELKVMKPYRGAESFEQLRLATEHSAHRPKVFLLTYGNLTMRKARSGFATNFFGVAGYEIIDNNGFATAKEGVEAALKAKADIVVLCSSDEEYPTISEEVCNSLNGKVKSIVLAGAPGDQEAEYRKQGINEFIHVKTDVLQCLTNLQKLMGIM